MRKIALLLLLAGIIAPTAAVLADSCHPGIEEPREPVTLAAQQTPQLGEWGTMRISQGDGIDHMFAEATGDPALLPTRQRFVEGSFQAIWEFIQHTITPDPVNIGGQYVAIVRCGTVESINIGATEWTVAVTFSSPYQMAAWVAQHFGIEGP